MSSMDYTKDIGWECDSDKREFSFALAWKLMKEGKKVKLYNWGGYWHLVHGEIIMHTKEGFDVNIKDTKDTIYTFDNVCSCRWMVHED